MYMHHACHQGCSNNLTLPAMRNFSAPSPLSVCCLDRKGTVAQRYSLKLFANTSLPYYDDSARDIYPHLQKTAEHLQICLKWLPCCAWSCLCWPSSVKRAFETSPWVVPACGPQVCDAWGLLYDSAFTSIGIGKGCTVHASLGLSSGKPLCKCWPAWHSQSLNFSSYTCHSQALISPAALVSVIYGNLSERKGSAPS